MKNYIIVLFSSLIIPLYSFLPYGKNHSAEITNQYTINGNWIKPGTGASDWGQWTESPCYKGIETRVRCKGYNGISQNYTWEIDVKNLYTKNMSCDICASLSNNNANCGWSDIGILKPGEALSDISNTVTWGCSKSSGIIYVSETSVALDNAANTFIKCDR